MAVENVLVFRGGSREQQKGCIVHNSDVTGSQSDNSDGLRDMNKVRDIAARIAAIRGNKEFVDYSAIVDYAKLPKSVRRCLDGYSKGMIYPLESGGFAELLSIGCGEFRLYFLRDDCALEFCIWSVTRKKLREFMQRAQQLGCPNPDWQAELSIDQRAWPCIDRIREYWVKAGIPSEVFSDEVRFCEFWDISWAVWGECTITTETAAGWLYGFWRGQEDQRAMISGNSENWKRSCAFLDEMIGTIATEYAFDPLP